ncbi:TonB-dependent receptor [Stenotrophomonas tumulicola]|uniref:TonB-dependent receptor n=1 Tax=Stenotrophomonas tumulicola TaxID=1685415 RepID=A0A7W3IGP0_9GAMM|nr:TonB-dependent receptor [Stenotrophomonas tumulicola]MBA8680436.1 TonB-dependent receptor [Stenotrophomonas tumulicola]
MNHPLRMSKLTLGLVAALAAAPAFAQSTSSGVGGQVTSNAGAPVVGAEVTITHTESGTVSRATTDASGRYVARGLRVGGPYTVTITKPGEGTKTEEGVFLSLNQVGTVNANLTGDIKSLDGVTVMAAAPSVFSSETKGIGTSVDGRKLELAPKGSRSLDDVARLDPRVTVTDQATGAISIAGVNNRYNKISVDGLSQGDPFGLNANGMPYTGSPISVDTIAAYDINVSDYDVSQDVVGAAVNAVTKSGTNEFHGSVYYVYKKADSMVGSRDGEDYDAFGKDTTKGFTLGGPILKDRLFFFGAYEEQEVTDFGGAASSDGFSTGAVTQDEINQVIDIAKNQYGIDPGTYGAAGGINLTNKRYLGKIDWNISDSHRASLTYQQTEETLPQPYDSNSSSVILTSRWFTKASETKNTSLQLFSDWSDNFTTEAKVSYQKFSQISGASQDLPAINVGVASTLPTSTNGVRFGEDRNRHENAIDTKKLTASFFGTYYAGDHTIKAGIDYENTEAYNMYGRDLHGVYSFDSIEDFAAGNYYRYDVRRPVDGFTEADTAAQIEFSQISPFIQDTWQVNNNLSITYGLRMNIPKAKEAPPRKPGFEETFGFRNDYKIGSSNKVILPRFSFNYAFDTERYSQLCGGAGLFQTVPPFVWLANPYQNNGVAAGSFCATRPDVSIANCVPNDGSYNFSVDPYNQPFPAGASAPPTAQMDTIDPDFKLPTVYKFTLGYDHELPWWGMVGTVELMHLKNKDAVFYNALNIGTPQGQLFDGRDSYWVTPGTGKNAGALPGYATNSTYLTNSDKGSSTAVTFSLDKPLSNGWYGNLAYTYTKATEVGSDTSSQGWSSYQFVSRLNPNEEIAGRATREIQNSIKLSLGWEHAFFGDYKTSFTGFYNGHDGLPYTWIVNGDINGDGVFQDPAYIPLLNDPNVVFVNGRNGAASADQIAEFQSRIDADPYLAARRGSVADRNGARNPWVNQLDVAIQQELPGFFKEHKSVLRLDIYNFLNMLDKKWGNTRNVGGFDTRYLAGLNRVTADGKYEYDLSNNAPQDLETYDFSSGYPHRVVSRWSAMLTLRYEF